MVKYYSMHIPCGMIFRKMFCCRCGEKLTKQKVKNTTEVDKFIISRPFNITIFYSEGTLCETSYVYKCPSCGNITSYKRQCLIAKRQKQVMSKILCEEDITDILIDNIDEIE